MSATPPAATALPILRQTLDNGLRVVLQADPAAPLVAVNLWYHVGSKNDRPGRTGLAHLFEHMLFQGSENVDTNGHFRHLQAVGGVANGSTWFDRTNYYETLPAQWLDLALWLESDRMGFLLPALDQAKLDNQREVVMNERRQRVDNQPYGRAFERLHELFFPADHPYHWPVIGYLEDLAAATLDDVTAFFRHHYAPGNAVLTLVGDLDPQRALESVRRHFEAIPPGPDRPTLPVSTALPGGERRETMPDRVELARLYLAFPAPPFGGRRWCAADLLCRVLAGGKSSRLWHDLVYERQIAQDVSAFVLPTELGSTLLITATARPGTELRRLEAAVGEHLDRIARRPVESHELRAARNQVSIGFWEEVEEVGQRADLFSLFTTYFDDPERALRQVDLYLEAGPEALAEAAVECFAADRRAVLEVVPERGEE